jgi:SOS response regulatory protein OraA/RecX
MQPHKRHEKKYYRIFTRIFLEVDPQEGKGKTKSTRAMRYRGCEERRRHVLREHRVQWQTSVLAVLFHNNDNNNNNNKCWRYLRKGYDSSVSQSFYRHNPST